MTKKAEFIYNTFLRISRSRQGKPFRYRKNFDEFDSHPDYVSVCKLENFFNRFPHIKIEDFITAPYEVYKEQTYYPLDFYVSLKATKVYTIYNKLKNDASPDSDEMLARIKQGFEYIVNFCIKNGYPLKDYIQLSAGQLPHWLIHLKEHNVCFYNLFGWDNFEDEFAKVNPDDINFVIGHLYDKIDVYRSRFFQSEKAKKLVRNGVKILENHVDSQLSKNK